MAQGLDSYGHIGKFADLSYSRIYGWRMAKHALNTGVWIYAGSFKVYDNEIACSERLENWRDRYVVCHTDP